MYKSEISQVFKEVALLVELSDPHPKKAAIYRRVAHTIDSLENLDTRVKENELEGLPGIGKIISKMINSLVETGRLPYFESLKKNIPYSLLELAQIPGLGPKRIRTLYEQLNVKTIEELETAILRGAFNSSGFSSYIS